jgi:LEA14-like dessication related protein
MLKLLVPLVFIAAIAGVGYGAYQGYTQLTVDVRDDPEVSIQLSESNADRLAAGVALVSGDVLTALEAAVEGVGVDVEAQIHNASSFPVYIPATTSRFLVNGTPVGEPIAVEGGMLSGGATRTIALQTVITLEQLPEAVVGVIAAGGEISLSARTSVGLAGIERSFDTDAYRYDFLASLRGLMGL